MVVEGHMPDNNKLSLQKLPCLCSGCTVNNSKVEINENNPSGTLVTTFETGPGYTMRLSGNNAPLFKINNSELLLNESIDYEEQAITVYITILNLNDNSPTFAQTSFNFSITEDLKVDMSIGSAIEATDLDMNTLYYELSGPDPIATTYFKLSSVNKPLILVNKTLDYDKYNHIQLILTARDNQTAGVTPSHTATTTINIDIQDVDDQPPQFFPCTKTGAICINDIYKGSVNRSVQATGVLTFTPGPIYAKDGDVGIDAPIEYSIVSGNVDDIFSIDKTSGNVTMKKKAENLGTIILQVMSAQANDQRKYSIATVQIEVKDKNEYPPVFHMTNYPGKIPSLAVVGSIVIDSSGSSKPLQVTVTDDDFPDKVNPNVRYKIENSIDFRITQDGFILTNAEIASPDNKVFTVVANDISSGEEARATVTVEIIPDITTTTAATTTSSTTGTGTTTTTTPGTGTTSITTPGTGTTTTTTPGTGTTTTTTPGTGTTTSTTPGTGTTTTTTPGTGTTTTTTPGTGTTTTTTPGTGTTTSTTPGTGTTTTTTPGTGTTTTTTPGTGTTTTTTPGTGTTTTTTPGTGTTTSTTPGTGTTTSTTPGTGTTTTTTPGTGTTTSTTPGTGTTTTTTPGIGTTTSTTPGTGTTTTTTPGTGTTTTTTPGTGTTTTTTPGTGTTTTTTAGTGTTTSTTPGTGTTTTTTPGTGTTTSTTPGTGTTTTTTPGTGTTTTTTPGTASPGVLLGKRYTVTDMAALGASLGAILALSLIGLGFLIYKQYGDRIRSRIRKGPGDDFGGSEDRTQQLIDNESGDDLNPDPILETPTPTNLDYGIIDTITEVPLAAENLVLAGAVASFPARDILTDNLRTETADDESFDPDDKKEVKSILTKEFKEDAGYKSVWFREDAAPEVVVIEGAEEGEVDDEEEQEYNNQVDDGDDEDEELRSAFPIMDRKPNNFML
ncbi:cadherin-related family member 5 [Rhinophrynus dorsalis]